MNKLHVFIVVVIFMLITGCKENVNSSKKTKMATIKLTREWNFVGSLGKHYVNINGENLGDINNGETKNISFTYNEKGNTLIVSELELFGQQGQSRPINFKAKEGDIIPISCVYGTYDGTTTLKTEYKENKKIIYTLRCLLTEKGNTSTNLTEKLNISTNLNTDATLVEAQSETVEVPQGVIVRTKKSRTISHDIELLQTDTQIAKIKGEFKLVGVRNCKHKRFKLQTSQF